MRVRVAGEQLELLPEKAIFWPARQSLLLADLHLGKIAHFRKAGIPLPVRASNSLLETFVSLINRTKPGRVIFLGDLFHSHYNYSWDEFGALTSHFSDISFELVTGNHDILSEGQYTRKNIRVYEKLKEGPFVLTHEPLPDDAGYNLAGHIHPGVRLKGKGRQSMTLPCFYFGNDMGILPSFGVFTGLARIEPKRSDQVYVVAEEKIIQVC